MIYGITATIPPIDAGGAPYLPNVGDNTGEALLDFVNGTYKVQGTTYALSALFTDAPGALGSADLASRVVSGRGYRSDYTSPTVGALADGALFTLMQAPHTFWCEFEDFDFGVGGLWYGTSGDPGYCGTYLDFANAQLNVMWPNGSGGGSTTNSSAVGTMKFGGVNRFAVTLGTTVDNVAINGVAPSSSNINGSDLFDGAGAYPSDEPLPLGAQGYASGNGDVLGGWVRWIAIKPALANSADLGPLTTLSTPSAVPRLSISAGSITSTTAVLTFTNASGATEHEAIIMGSTQVPSDDCEFPTQTISSGGTLTGLTANTSYRVYIRGRNSYGPGPFYDGAGYCRVTFTTTS